MQVQQSRLLHEAMLFRALAAAFAYPDDDFRSALESGAFAAALCSGVAMLDDATLTARADEVYDAIADLSGNMDDLAEEYSALFLRKVPCSPYGSRYQTPAALYRSRVLADVSGFYRALGLRPALDRPDLPDHIGAELEFLGLVTAHEHQALEVEEDERAAQFRELADQFASEQIGEWIGAFRARLGEHARLRFYPAIADLAIALLEYRSPGVTAPVWPGMIRDDEGDDNERSASTFDCGPVAG
jgi:putative dimethyl sulfoxide reductase chaperone